MSKRATAGRGAGSPQRPFETLLDFSNGPVLPPVAVGTSHNYGATGPTALPKEAAHDPIQDVMGMVKRINTGLDDSEQRISLSRTGSVVPSRSGSIHTSRRTKREPTPDDQLFRALREATESPTREVHSDRTPTPPIPRAVSTDSSPDIPPPRRKNSLISEITNSPMYPKPLRQLSNFFSREEPDDGTPHRHSSVDNASEVSFELERTIHDGELQRTRPSDHGSNLSKAPRRPSGVQLQPTIEEEDEPSSVLADQSDFVNPADQTWTAEARTVFPSRFQSLPRSESRSDEPVLQEPQQWDSSSSSESRIRDYMRDISGAALKGVDWIAINWFKTAGILLFSMLLVGAYQTNICDGLGLFAPSGEYSNFPSNGTDPAVREIRSRLSDMSSQISSLSKELKSSRSEQKGLTTGHPTNMPYNAQLRSMDLQINFLSPSNGAMVDPHATSPSASESTVKPVSRLRKFLRGLNIFSSGDTMKAVHEQLAALLPWEEAGDCWCSVKEAQLAVFLGRAIVPEELVIEHIPMTATLDPTSAPKIVEMWAQFVVVDSGANDGEEYESDFDWKSPYGGGKNQRQSKKPRPAKKQGLGNFNLPGANSLSEVLMSALKRSNPHSDPEDYSDDPLLGPNFYRIGRFFYDIKELNYRQAFALSPIIDIPTIRVDKVVLRVKENWGSNQTCLYRFKLHGHA
ncbi:hypothetical protein N7481_010740 [Penicillium waksmanii]|uniref:uncharacterized protein n=1 Tax=Penicillium waksmanii TaxID=69791 RepID=UPI0025488346|nr:uncharacterized protein N7481_010740 [Penicillium waksmanii]KAJ5973530.1 hypothetical protein N7481_010740 [Penicillium waksmanii]